MDQLNADEVAALPGAYLGTLTRMGERIASVDARLTAEVAAIKEDTSRIRTGQHDINNTLMRSIAAEQECAFGLKQLTAQLTSHTEQLTSLAASVRELATVKAQAEGAWFVAGKVLLWLIGLGASLGTAFAVVSNFMKYAK